MYRLKRSDWSITVLYPSLSTHWEVIVILKPFLWKKRLQSNKKNGHQAISWCSWIRGIIKKWKKSSNHPGNYTKKSNSSCMVENVVSGTVRQQLLCLCWKSSWSLLASRHDDSAVWIIFRLSRYSSTDHQQQLD